MTKGQKKLIWLALAGILGAIFGGWLLRAFAPFLLGLVLALAAEPLVRGLGRLGIRRKLGAPLAVGAVLGSLGAAVVALCRGVVGMVSDFVPKIPGLLTELSAALSRLGEGLLDSAPEALRQYYQRILDQMETMGERVVSWALSQGVGMATDVVQSVPEVLLFLVTVVTSAFLLSARLPELWRSLRRRIPEDWGTMVTQMGGTLRRSAKDWCLAQCQLMGVTFLTLAAGLLVLRVPWAGAVAALIALVDALPVLGTGTVLIPWALIEAAGMNTGLAVGLLVLYGVVTLVRNLLEPRILGRQMGLSPLISLVALYLGWKLLGVVGLILAPFVAICLREVWKLPWEESLASRAETVYNQGND